MKRYITKTSSETKKLAEDLSEKILKPKTRNKTVVLALEGDLGTGKTTFIQGIAKGLGIRERILSPTFVLIKRFEFSNSQNFYHIDCYRIKDPKELLDLGFKEIISNPKNLIAVEWSDRVKKIIPKSAIKLKFDFINKNTRKITIR